MARIVHIALKVDDLERATKFYAELFGLQETGTGYARGHVSRHMTDGEIDVALMVYDNEDVEEAQLSGAGPCIHHWGIEVEDRDATAKLIEENGGEIVSKPGEGALKFRAPNGTVAEIVRAGRYKTFTRSARPRVVRIAITVKDLEASARFYETVFGFQQVIAGARTSQPMTRHLTDGNFDLMLVAYDGEAADPLMKGSGPKIHHWGIAVGDPQSYAGRIAMHGGTVLSHAEASSLTYRAPDGTIGEIVAHDSLVTSTRSGPRAPDSM